jgi:U3 small nucleolar RNA-associated protein 19
MAGKADADLLSSAIRILVAIPKSDGQLTDCFSATENDPAKLTRLLRKKLQETWMIVLRSSMSKSQRKTILRNAVDNILPTLPRGEILMDFFTDSFGFGGEMSLLALSGLFHLMMEKNLDYPLFYRKLYSLLDEGLVWSVHRSRIFRLLDVCLGSTHLPAALVASFIKRLSRLALRAPPAAIVIAIPWIYNLFKMHATCTFMMHRVVGKDEPVEDPFDMEEEDPMLTGAIDSCVWELVSLQSHYHPNVATLAKIISEQFTKQQYNMEDFLDYSYASVSASCNAMPASDRFSCWIPRCPKA